MRFFLYGAHVPTADLVPLAVEAEAAGFHGLTIPEHILHPMQSSTSYPYAGDGGSGRPPWDETHEWPDALIAASAVTAATKRLEVLTAVYVLPLHHPVHVAKALSTLDVLSGSRVILGVGTGWLREEFEALGEDFATRGARSTEAIEVMRKLWVGRPVRHDGAFFSFPEVAMQPVPAAPVRIYVGGDAPPALRRAAAHGDGLIPPLKSLPRTAELIDEVARLRREAGRTGPFEYVAPGAHVAHPDEVAAIGALGAEGLHVDPFTLYLGRNTQLGLDERRGALERYAREVLRG